MASEVSNAEEAPYGPTSKFDYHLEGVRFGNPFIKESVEKCMKFDFHPEDTIIVGFPKSGKQAFDSSGSGRLFGGEVWWGAEEDYQ